MRTHRIENEPSIARQLRPIVTVVTAVSVTVFALLVTTATLGASPIDSMAPPEQLAMSE
jgi:hypothetical protein